MATTKQLASYSKQKPYWKVTLYKSIGITLSNVGVDISRFLEFDSISSITKSVDPNAFDIGIFFTSKITLKFHNESSKFSQSNATNSFFRGGKIDNSNIVIEAGYIDINGIEVPNLSFDGLIDERTYEEDASGFVTFEVFGFDNLFTKLKVETGLNVSSVKNVIFQILDRPEITNSINLNILNINPNLDFSVDNPIELVNKSVKDALNSLLTASNSVLFIDSTRNIIVRGREENIGTLHQFVSNPLKINIAENIYSIVKTSGLSRVFNFLQDGAVISEPDQNNIDQYGIIKKTFEFNFISSNSIKQQILDRIRQEYQNAKEELEIKTDYLGDAINLLDRCHVEVYPNTLTENKSGYYGQAIYGVSTYGGFEAGVLVDGSKYYKVIKINHDIKKFYTTIRIREVGKSQNDGYTSQSQSNQYGYAIYGSAQYS